MLTNRFAARLLSAAFSSVLFLLPLNLAQVANAQTAVAIHTIEANPLSYNGQSVTVTGIIVAKRSNGFYLEAKQSNWNSPLTSASEAVFVYSTSTTGAFASSVGTEVSVTGTVTLYSASTPTGPVKETEITAPTVTVVAAGTPASLTTLVPAVTLLPTDTSTTDYASALKYQSMRVKIPSLTTTQGTDGTLSEANETYTSLGTFYGVITGVPRAFREPGIQITVDLPAAAPSPLDIPRWDGNPEVLLVNSIATGGATIDTTANVKLTNLVGVLDYSVGQATFVIDPDTTQARDPLPTMITAQALPARAANEFTVASYNVERFYNSTTAYHGSTQLTAAALALRLNKLSLAIRHILNYPDIIGIQEMSSTSATDPTGTLKLVSDKISADAIAAGETDPHYAYYLVQDTDGTGINTAFLVNTNRVTVNSVTSIGSGVTYINSTGASATLNDRAPLILDATIKAQNGYAAYPVIVISNHLLSLTDIDNQDASAANKRIKRERQAEYLSNIIQGYQATGKHVISVGDHNAFQFSDGYADTLGVIKGTPAANNTVDVGTTSSYVKPTPALVDLVTNLPADQQYSYVFVGNAQVLDHIVVTSDLASAGAHIAYAHMDSEFPAVYRNDATRPEVNSDHDAGLGYFALPADTGGAAITPGSKDFGSITVNTTTAAQTFTFTNSAASSINLTSITASGNFAVTGGTCSTSAPLAAAGTCTITVTFTPTAVGARTGTLTVVSSNVVTSTATASLTGTGTSSAVTITLTPGTADFGSVTQASTSAAQTFTVTNSSSTTLAINSIAASGDFTATAITCSLTTPIAANGSCTISVTFTPTALGARTGTLTVLTGSSTYPTLTASLTGTGAALSITLTPGTANFGSITQATTSAAQTFTVTNTSSTTLALTSIVASGDFAATPVTCSLTTPIAANSSCTINVTFTPTALGARTGTLTVLTGSSAYPSLTAALTGTGAAVASTLVTLTPTTANFGSINQGSTSTAQTFTITNTAPTSLTIGSFSVSGDFAATLNTCSLSTPLAGGASCTINVTFTPTATGARAGALTVLTSSIYYPALTATLTGTGLATTTPSYTLTSTPPTSSVTVSAGSPANIVLTVTPVNGYTGTVTVNCVGLNVTGVACPGKSVNLGAATPLTLTITTTSRVLGAGIGLLDLHRPWMLTLVILFGLVLAMLLFGARNHRLLRGAGLFALLFALLAAGNGCGKGGSAPVSTTNPNGTPAGQYTFSITATDGVTANTKTLPYTLIVQ